VISKTTLPEKPKILVLPGRSFWTCRSPKTVN